MLLLYIKNQRELFDSNTQQNAENSTVAKSLPLLFKYSVKCLFVKRLD